jgi:hypothetical protein
MYDAIPFLTWEQFTTAIFGVIILGLLAFLWAWRRNANADGNTKDIIIQQAAKYPEALAELHQRITNTIEKHAKDRERDLQLNGALRQEVRHMRTELKEVQTQNQTLRDENNDLIGQHRVLIAEQVRLQTENDRLRKERDEARTLARQYATQLKTIHQKE